MRLSYYTLNNTMIYQCQQLGSLLVYYVVENWRLRQWLNYKLKYVFPIIGKDFLKMIFGLLLSVGIVI